MFYRSNSALIDQHNFANYEKVKTITKIIGILLSNDKLHIYIKKGETANANNLNLYFCLWH